MTSIAIPGLLSSLAIPNNYYDFLEKTFHYLSKKIVAAGCAFRKNPKADFMKEFFGAMQNKFHFAITGSTAAELVVNRISGKLEKK